MRAGWLLGLRLVVLTACCSMLTGCGGGADYAAESPGSGGNADGAMLTGAPMQEAEAGDYEFDDVEVDADRAPMEVTTASRSSAAEAPPPPSPAPMGGSASGPSPQGAPPPPPRGPPPPPKLKKQQQKPPAATGQKRVATPLLIYRAELWMAVVENERVLERTERLARSLGGYLVRRSNTSIVIRIPSAKFQRAMNQIGAFGEVQRRNVEVEDVTEKFFDMAVRLRNARAVRDRFQKLLAAAKSVEESLAIERELERITDKIEVLEGKLKRLRELIAFSTITLNVSPRAGDKVGTVKLPFPWLQSLGLPNLMSL